MVKAHTHLHFDGNCLDALKFYEKCLNGKITFSFTWGESPEADKVPKNWSKKILHASLEFGGQMLTADDAAPGHYNRPQGFQVLLSYGVVADAERVFSELATNGLVTMPFGKTFWSKGFGMLVDQFGIPWMINSDAPKK